MAKHPFVLLIFAVIFSYAPNVSFVSVVPPMWNVSFNYASILVSILFFGTFELRSVFISVCFDKWVYGYSFSAPKDNFAHGDFEKNALYCCISFWSFLGFIGSDFLRIWGYFELNLWNWSKELSLWCPKIKTHMKSDQNRAQIVRKWCFVCGWLKLGA